MIRKRSFARILDASSVLICLAAIGCGGASNVKLVKVSGTLTINEEPLPNASVIFRPVAGGRLSHARTDDNGRYRLEYLPGQPGALAGAHQVSVSTYVEPDKDSSDPERQAGQPETIPVEYNAKTKLEVDVPQQRSVTLDFDLESKPQSGRLSLAN